MDCQVSLFDKLKQHDNAHFCEHDGICINFTQARTTWHALAPCALKPWWLFLNPLRKNRQNKITKNTDIEVTEDA